MIEVFAKGIAAGLAIAAPVGPIGLLCIRRSMNQGRAAGLATGMGAATADGTYGMLVALGFAATGVLLSYAPQMQVFGGLLITYLGLRTLRGFLTKRHTPEPPIARPRSVASAFGTTYLLTLSNPATILAFAGMVAGLGGAAASGPNAPYVLVIGVFLGSALWWLFLVQLSLWARTRMTARSLRWLDVLAGSALVIWGIALAFGPLQDGSFWGST
ncbi:LysE family translocator [Thalassobius sp. S69A]|uniref:LysE family translocator n=1 Tax=unclassified Thalassovita TaxID=2619711 RepID=UPI003C7A3700